jgi:hypothetical protein
MQADERRRLELKRLVAEIRADVAVLSGVANAIAAAKAELSRTPARSLLAMVAVDLHRYYTAIENILERSERVVGALPPSGPAWHRDLLFGASRELADARPPILSAGSARDLEGLLSFRHFFRHAYAVEFDPVRLDALAGHVASVHARVVNDLSRFTSHLDSLADGLKT